MARLKQLTFFVSGGAVFVGILTGDARLFLFGLFSGLVIFFAFNGDQEGRL